MALVAEVKVIRLKGSLMKEAKIEVNIFFPLPPFPIWDCLLCKMIQSLDGS